MAKKKAAAGKSNGKAASTPLATKEQTSYIKDLMKEVAKQQIELMQRRPALSGSIKPSGKYDGDMHGQLVALKSIGLAHAHVAQAAGIAPGTLTGWCEKYPMLAADLERAESLAIASAGTMLQAMMIGDDDRAFRAVKFFLESHAVEFRSRSKPDLAEDLASLIGTIRENIYGLPAERELPSPAKTVVAEVIDAEPPSIDDEFAEFEKVS